MSATKLSVTEAVMMLCLTESWEGSTSPHEEKTNPCLKVVHTPKCRLSRDQTALVLNTSAQCQRYVLLLVVTSSKFKEINIPGRNDVTGVL